MSHMKDGLFIDKNGSHFWYLDGELHREDGPAIMYKGSNGSVWMYKGKKHRDGGAPALNIPDKMKAWYMYGKLHRVDGPAVMMIPNTNDEWWLNGTLIIPPEGIDTMEEFIEKLNNDEAYSLQWISHKNGIILFIKNPSGAQQRLNAMRWKI